MNPDMTNPERCPKCGAGKLGDYDGGGTQYECGWWEYVDCENQPGLVSEIAKCHQRQLDQHGAELAAQAAQLQSLAERVKMVENHFPDAGKKEGSDE